MRSSDRSFIVSTLSVLQEQRRQSMSILDDMNLRLDELEDFLYDYMTDIEYAQYEQEYDDAWISGRNFAQAEQEWENDKIVYDSSRKKHCMCDACWSDHTDTPGYRMD